MTRHTPLDEYGECTCIDRHSHAGTVVALVDTIRELCDHLVVQVKIDMTNNDEVQAIRDLHFSHGFSHLNMMALVDQAQVLLSTTQI